MNFIIIHLWLVYIDVMEVVILLMICQVEGVFLRKQKMWWQWLQDINGTKNMIARINESITLRHISCSCKCKFDSKKCNSNRRLNKELCQCSTTVQWNVCEKIIFVISEYLLAKLLGI